MNLKKLLEVRVLICSQAARMLWLENYAMIMANVQKKNSKKFVYKRVLIVIARLPNSLVGVKSLKQKKNTHFVKSIAWT
jgi:hypothetical protein